MACVTGDGESYSKGDLAPPNSSPDEKKPIPRRNLTQAFEALCVDTSEAEETVEILDSTKENQQPPIVTTLQQAKQQPQPAFFSPTSVTQQLEPHTPPPKSNSNSNTAPQLGPYTFNLHRDLSRDLSPALINRVSLYAVIHDVNKEAAAMAANDPQNKEDNKEELSPLVQAVNGSETVKEGPEVKNAMIDEETWLLEAITNRSRSEENNVQACPPTFLQAMGEKEYENPVHALSGASRTQLWKPSRSWWEAKSGKNPWIEPNSHNKRWRYLWPFIHYHKFLAKCIKKLKRNGADVKHSVSPVAVFLREEVCAVSDHLAAVSLFGSEEWMGCLQHFRGWTAHDAEDVLLAHVRQLKLRPLHEPGDVDSPLLRSQIDEHFLKAMAIQREQLREIPTTIEAPKKPKGQPPVYPRPSTSAAVAAATAAAASPPSVLSPTNLRRPRYPSHHPSAPQYWQNTAAPPPGYEPQVTYGDNSSVQSGISTESGFAQYPEYPPAPHHMAPHLHYPPYYSAPMYHGHGGSHQYPMEPHQEVYPMAPPPQHHPGWLDPALAPYGVQPYYNDMAAVSPASPQEPRTTTDKEEKEDHTSDVTPHFKISPQHSPPHQGYSPFWSHLVDGAAQSLATPAKSPSTPNRSEHQPSLNGSDHAPAEETPDGRLTAQPLLLRGYPYGYGHYGARDGYAPPSPATQFMMAPATNATQTNNATFYYGGYTPSYSPGRLQQSPKHSSAEPPTPVRKMVEMVHESPSPNTVETSTETESC